MSDTVIVYVATKILPKKGLKAHHFRAGMEKYEPDDQPCRISYTGGYFRSRFQGHSCLMK